MLVTLMDLKDINFFALPVYIIQYKLFGFLVSDDADQNSRHMWTSSVHN